MDLEEAQRALSDATARIAELEGRVTALTGERDALTDERTALAGRASELEAAQTALDARLTEATGAQSAVSADLDETRRALETARGRSLSYLRRALLAEQAGQMVPELVGGDDEEALLASVDVARQAYGRAVETARLTMAQQSVPIGAPSMRTAPAAGLSPLEMIESGLRR